VGLALPHVKQRTATQPTVIAYQGVQYDTALKRACLMLSTRIDGDVRDVYVLGPRWDQTLIHAAEHTPAVSQANDWNWCKEILKYRSIAA